MGKKYVDFSVNMHPTAHMRAGALAAGHELKETRPHVADSLLDLRITQADSNWPEGYLWAVVERWPDQMKEAILIAGHAPTLMEATVAGQMRFEAILRERST